MSGPLRRTRRDLIATGIIGAVSVAAVAGVALTAPINGSQLYPGDAPEAAPLTEVPTGLTAAFTLPDGQLPGQHLPITVADLVITTQDGAVTAHDPAGDEVWRYERDREICTVGTAWRKVVVTFRNNAGCGDVVAISAETGQYDSTRSAPAPDDVALLNSNDRVGTVAPERLELWRSDLVRTVEYGEVEAEQEPDNQPHADCRITSALTRTELLATTEACPDGTYLRFQDTTPEDSRTPQISQEVAVPAESRLVAIGQEAAAVYAPTPAPEIVSYDLSGSVVTTSAVEASSDYRPATADLPHHMSWFDGQRLYLFGPTRLQVDHVFEDAVGTGVAVGEQLLYPTAAGIAVVDGESGEQLRLLPVDRGSYSGEVSLAVAGETIVEKRGGDLVGLTQTP